MVLPLPDESTAVVPLPSSNFHQPTNPVEAETVNVVEPLIDPEAA
jgi:hypothetical protein